ncbi:hypothetical protein CISIN_1g038392mg [Citrus sinensis]|uniref:Bulb-type lectin domain-containing protein n=1 Tax=Citrus sinensis TaxID=2711 RepID=A0A067G6Y3_CITSI|nr:hypothetical protein CISIN_1g038392mg [Citrus sinensis]
MDKRSQTRPVWKKSGFNSGSGERKWHPGLEPRRLNPDPDPDFAIPTGNLVLTSQNKSVVWSANLSKEVRTPVVLQLLDSGNLVLRGERDGGSETYLWQSLDYPSDTLLPGMKLGWDLKTGLERRITSWKSSDDPSPGDFFWKIERQFYPELVMWKGSRKFYRTGPWNGIIFSASSLRLNLIFKYHFVSNEDELYYTFYLTDKAVISRIVMNQTVSLRQRFIWRKKNQSWELYSNLPKDQCDSYGLCGANGIFIISQSPICQCLEGFLTNSGRFVDWSQGCVRNKPLNYSRRDGFIKFSELKLPDSTSSWETTEEPIGKVKIKTKTWSYHCFELATIAIATDNFSTNKKLGEGGFGPVYKGTLADGQEIVVKRFSKISEQGLKELKNDYFPNYNTKIL